MKISDIKNSGKIEALTIAGAASAFRITVVIAIPKQLNVIVPLKSAVIKAKNEIQGHEISPRKSNWTTTYILIVMIIIIFFFKVLLPTISGI